MSSASRDGDRQATEVEEVDVETTEVVVDDDWAWRRRIRSSKQSYRIYRMVVGALGFLIVATGVVLLPLPGPGWLIIFLGLGIWASEFAWAQRLLRFARDKVRAWEQWLRAQPRWVAALVGLGCLLLVLGIFWILFMISGVPTWLPDFARDFLLSMPGL